MTTPQPPQPPPCDTGNALLAEVPALFTASLIDTPQGQRLLVTIRTASTTLTILLGGADAKQWAANFSAVAAMMSANGLVAANGALRLPGQNGSNGHGHAAR